MTVSRTRASRAPNKSRPNREDFLFFATDAYNLDEPVWEIRESAAMLGVDRTLLPPEGRVKMKGEEDASKQDRVFCPPLAKST